MLHRVKGLRRGVRGIKKGPARPSPQLDPKISRRPAPGKGVLIEVPFGEAELAEARHLIDADKSDLYDVLAYIRFALSPITREERVNTRKATILSHYDDKLQGFLDFVLGEYVKEGVSELDQSKLTHLLELKYRTVNDADVALGGSAKIRSTFIGFQRFLYAREDTLNTTGH